MFSLKCNQLTLQSLYQRAIATATLWNTGWSFVFCF